MKTNYEDVKKALYNIKQDVKKILCANGGMNNGYETYAEGTIEKRCFGRINAMIPGIDVTKRSKENSTDFYEPDSALLFEG